MDELDYNFSHPQRGLCVIFSNELFNGTEAARERRQISKIAVNNCFEKMGFNVVSFDGLTVDEIRRVITYLAAEDYSNSDCFVCVLLTNGRKNIVMAKDGAYSIDLLYASFEKNESLRGKPKMFFVQADCEHPNDSLSNLPLQHHLHAKVPVVPDFLVVVSSPNELRCSSINCRSLFLETLVYCFEKYLRTDDLLSVLTIVNGMLEVSNLGSMRKDHTLSITSTLTKRVFIHANNNHLRMNFT